MADVPALGPRGEGWVAAQVALLAGVAGAALLGPGWPEEATRVLVAAGVVLAAAGAVLLVVSARALGRALTPFPRPRARTALAAGGPYRVVRHPMYSAGLLFCAGVALASSWLALVPTALLLVVWALKAAVEERFLLETVPGYAEYRERTRFRLVPYLH